MRNFLDYGLPSNDSRNRRSGFDGLDDVDNKYLTPAAMFLRLGAVILVAICVALAGNLVANTLGN
jgi:hypothetical protein